MIELEKARQTIERGLEFADAEETEVLLYGNASALTRYSNSAIHQNVAEDNVAVSFRLVNGGRTGCASTNKLDDDSLRDAIARAAAFSAAQRPDPNYKGLPGPAPIHSPQRRYESTALFGAEERAEAVRMVIDTARRSKMDAAGVYSVTASVIGVGNSRGVMAVGDITEGLLTALVTAPDSTGFGEALAADVTQIDPALVGVLEEADLGQTHVLVCSDHGNLEDLSVRTHTRNPVPTLIWGPLAQELALRIRSIHRIPVLRDGKVVGLVTAMDVVRMVADGKQE